MCIKESRACVCGCAETMQFKTPPRTYFHVFPYLTRANLTRAKLFHSGFFPSFFFRTLVFTSLCCDSASTVYWGHFSGIQGGPLRALHCVSVSLCRCVCVPHIGRLHCRRLNAGSYSVSDAFLKVSIRPPAGCFSSAACRFSDYFFCRRLFTICHEPPGAY